MQHAQELRAVAESGEGIRGIPKSAMPRGIACFGAPGVGKSRYLGREAVWFQFLDEIPTIVLDPTGGTIDNFLDVLIRHLAFLPQEECDKVWERIIYCDMHGKDGYVIPWPFFYRLGTERSLWEISERYLQVLLRSDPSLATRPIMGWPPMHKIGVYAGMLLSALGFQITEIFDLLQQPQFWHDRFQEAQYRYPTVAEAVAYFRETYIPMRPADRERLTNPLLEKLFPIRLDRRLRALFGGAKPGINFAEVAAKGQVVLLDFRHVRGQMLRFKLLWVFDCLMEYIKSRGRSPTPLGIVIDEFPQMTVKVSDGPNPLVSEFETLINAYMRSSQIWLFLGLQSPLQLDPELRQLVLSLGSYLIGQQATPLAARILSDNLFLTDPFKVKRYRERYHYVPAWEQHRDDGVIEEPDYLPLLEQREIYANCIRKLHRYQFLLRPAVNEGEIGQAVFPISIRDVDPGHFPERELLEPLYPMLATRSGTHIDVLIQEQDARLKPAPTHRVPIRHRNPETDSKGAVPETLEPAPLPEPHRRVIQRRRLVSQPVKKQPEPALSGSAKIISALSHFPYLTVEQLTRLSYAASSITYVRKALKALLDQGIVFALGGRAENLPLVYTLSSKGRQAAVGLGMPQAGRFRQSDEQEKGTNVFFLRHTMEVTDVLISARLLSNTHQHIALTRMYTEGELKRKIYVTHAPREDKSREMCLEPDGSLEFQLTETRQDSPKTWEDFFHIEVYRTHLTEWRYKQKVRGYVSYIESGVHEQHFGTPAFSLAVIAQTTDLAERLKQWTEEVLASLAQPEQGVRFFFRSCDPATVSLEELFLSPCWKQACSTAKTPLLVLE